MTDMTDQMTDARALDLIRAAIDVSTAHEQIDAEPALHHIASRLRTLSEPADTGYLEILDRQNDSLRRAICAIMARLTELLDEDQFAHIDAIALAAGVQPPPPALSERQSDVFGYWIPNARACSDGTYEDGSGELVLAGAASDSVKAHGTPVYTRPRPAAGDAVPESQSVFALRALVAAGHVEQRHVDGALSLARGCMPVAAQSRTLYIDLDGVMADFDGSFPAVFGLDHRSLADDEMWLHINGHETFFRDLPPMAGAVDFFRSVEHLQPVILTACPKSNYPHVAAQKRAWVREHLSQTCLVLPVLGGRHKPLFMHQRGDVLIDDWGKNCHAWVEAGGIAIKHEGTWDVTRAALSAALSNRSDAEGVGS